MKAINFAKFTSFGSSSNKIIIAASIRPLVSDRSIAKYGQGMCKIYTDYHYNPIVDALPPSGIVSIEEAKEVLAQNGFVESSVDFNITDNKYDLKKVKAIAPKNWFYKYEAKITFLG